MTLKITRFILKKNNILYVKNFNLFKTKDEINILDGSIPKALFYLSLPLIITNLLQTAYNLADTIWVGQYSTDALAAISFTFPLVFLLISIGLGISIAGSVLVAQRIGLEKPEYATFAASQTVTYAILGSIVIGLIGYVTAEPILRLVGASESVLPLANSYMQIISIGLPFMFGFIVFTALSRGSGDTVTPMILMTGSVVLNIILDPILIFGFTDNPLFIWTGLESVSTYLFELTAYTGSGIKGAAYATIVSRALAFTAALYVMFYTQRSVTINLSDMYPNITELKQLLSIGIPASFETVSRAVSVNLMLFIVGLFPTEVVAGYGVGIRIFSVVFLPAVAVSQSVETITGQNYGANNMKRLVQTNHIAAKSMFGLLVLLGGIVWFSADLISAVFTNDPQVKQVAKSFVLIVAPTFGFTGVLRAYSGGFRGVGKTKISAFISIFTFAIIRIPIAYILSTRIGSSGIWYSFVVSNIAGAIVALVLFMYFKDKL